MSKPSKQYQFKTSWRESVSDSKLISPSKLPINESWCVLVNRSFCELKVQHLESHRVYPIKPDLNPPDLNPILTVDDTKINHLSFVVGQQVKLDLAFNNVKPKDWYFVIDLVQLRKGSGCVTLRGWSIKLNSRLGYFILVHFTICISKTWNWKSSIRILFCQRSRQI